MEAACSSNVAVLGGGVPRLCKDSRRGTGIALPASPPPPNLFSPDGQFFAAACCPQTPANPAPPLRSSKHLGGRERLRSHSRDGLASALVTVRGIELSAWGGERFKREAATLLFLSSRAYLRGRSLSGVGFSLILPLTIRHLRCSLRAPLYGEYKPPPLLPATSSWEGEG